ncbi:MAG TPA: UDP-N-acetylmuramoyl-L-alanyl-D-glutamate--2,6-diaminopimelate ligase, partial [Candidatus Cloacimonadota bacterium]|nr:UDP-N-acetylmuramoyl-L-alanyl-D-glutamate--2,6-diaminopimelate ligase [Candidatus Cloacimonadota bacterium]
MKIREIIDVFTKHNILVGYNHIKLDKEISGMPQTNSQLIKPGDIFVAISGFTVDGHQFSESAAEQGASLIIHEKFVEGHLPAIGVKDTRKAAALLAKLYYKNPSSKFKLIGVTGTNGKTTITSLIYDFLTSLGHKVGLIGTLGYSINDRHYPSERTTPDIMDLNRIFADMVEAGCEFVVMEVSSHALSLDRVYGIEFDFSIFTNLSRDHLDFHKNMDSYASAKFQLLEYVIKNNGHNLINIDDSYGSTFYRNTQTSSSSISFDQGDFSIRIISQAIEQSRFEMNYRGMTFEFQTTLLGRFNIMNLAMAIASIHLLLPKVPFESIAELAKSLKAPEGRLEAVPNHRNLGIFVDYAHTPDALENVLRTLRELKPNRLFCVVGAGGDRDKGKRPEMGRVAVSNADVTIFTNDNPRSENPVQIIRDIVDRVDPLDKYWVIRDRRIAIESAIHLAQSGDIILLAGKGHENYQEIKGVKHHFDDFEIAENALTLNDNPSEENLAIPIDPLMLDLLYRSKLKNSEHESVLTSVSTDSRSIKDHSLFFAIKGENFDGHSYLDEVLAKDGSFAIVSMPGTNHYNTIQVSDTVIAMGLLARKYLSLFNIKKIALTGSVGKTTTKEFIYNVVKQHGLTLKTLANENNHIGLPKTIFRIQPTHAYAVLELGTNHFGEIKHLADICQPHIGIITNIGPSHLEFLEDEDGVFREKTALFNRKLEAIIYPGDDSRFTIYKDKGISFGLGSQNTYQLKEIITREGKNFIQVNGVQYEIPTPIPYYALNATIAVALGKVLGFSDDSIQKGISEDIDLGWRMKMQESNGRKLIADCYNANPTSMLAALKYFLEIEPGKPHVAILGDMLELGEKSDEYHKEIGAFLKTHRIKDIIAVGEKSKFFESVHHFDNVDQVLDSGILESL